MSGEEVGYMKGYGAALSDCIAHNTPKESNEH